MPRQLLLEAHSPDEARERAAALLNESADNARTVVVQPGRRGILRWRQRPALIRVSFIASSPTLVDASTDPRMPTMADLKTETDHSDTMPVSSVQVLRSQGLFDQDQTLAEIRSGELVIHPGSGNKPVRIKVDEGITMKVDGDEIQGEASLTGQESVAFHFEGHPVGISIGENSSSSAYHVAISPDGMTATLQFHFRRRFRLRTTPPSDRLLITREVEKVLPPEVTLDSIHKSIKGAGVVFGLDVSAVEAALTHTLSHTDEETPTVIARGLEAEPGIDGRLEACIQVNPDPVDWASNDDAVDYRERHEIPSVTAGTVLALIHAPKEGKAGQTVQGNPVPAPQTRPVNLRAGNGIRQELKDDHAIRLVSNTRGRPVIQEGRDGHWRVNVLPTFVHEGDVDMETGNLIFGGDISIRGQVAENMKVIATGNIRVAGAVSGGTLLADGNIEVRGNVIKGRLVAGYRTLLYDRLNPLLHNLDTLLHDLQAAAGQLEGAAAGRMNLISRFTGRFLPRLITMKFPQLPELAVKLLEAASVDELDGNVDDDLIPLVDACNALQDPSFPGSGLSLSEVAEIVRIAVERAAFHHGGRGGVRVGHVHNSSVRATSDIGVMRKGTYYSKLTTKTGIKVYGPAIGGRLEGVSTIRASESGSKNMAPTLMKVASGGSIHIGLAYPHTRIQVGETSQLLDREHRGVHAAVKGRRLQVSRQ